MHYIIARNTEPPHFDQFSFNISQLGESEEQLNYLYICFLLIEAAYRFYKTRCEQDSSQRRGKNDETKKKKRHHVNKMFKKIDFYNDGKR